MITFSVALILLVAGYFLYGKLMERVMKPDANATTPAVAHPDGVDYIAPAERQIRRIGLPVDRSRNDIRRCGS